MLNDQDGLFDDKDLDKQFFIVTFGFPGKHLVSDRDSVIKDLKVQSKWQDKNPVGNLSNNTRTESGIAENSGNNNSETVDGIPQSLPLTFGQGTFNKLKKRS